MDVTINTAKNMIEHYAIDFVKKGLNDEKLNYLPIFLHGAPGVGKSMIVRDAAKAVKAATGVDFGFVDERLANFEPSDVAGIPYVSHAGLTTEQMKFSIPSWVPTKERVARGDFPKYGLLMLDEMSNASVQVQQAAYRVVLDRELHHGVTLAEGWMIVAAGNRKEDKTGANDLKPALGNRFGTHLTVTTNAEIWTKWALRAGIHQKVIAFVNAHPQLLHDFKPSDPKPSFPSPRSWQMVSDWICVGLPDNHFHATIAGCVGESAAMQFATFLKYYHTMPNWNKVMKGEESYCIKEGDRGLKIAITYALIQCFSDACQTPDKEKKIDRIKNLEKVLQQLPTEFKGLVYRQLKYAVGTLVFRTVMLETLDTFQEVGDLIAA